MIRVEGASRHGDRPGAEGPLPGSEGIPPRTSYPEVAALQSLRTRLDRLYADATAPPTRGLVRGAFARPGPDPLLPRPTPATGPARDPHELHEATRDLLRRHATAGDGPEGAMLRIVRTLHESRERLRSRLGGRG